MRNLFTDSIRNLKYIFSNIWLFVVVVVAVLCSNQIKDGENKLIDVNSLANYKIKFMNTDTKMPHSFHIKLGQWFDSIPHYSTPLRPNAVHRIVNFWNLNNNFFLQFSSKAPGDMQLYLPFSRTGVVYQISENQRSCEPNTFSDWTLIFILKYRNKSLIGTIFKRC